MYAKCVTIGALINTELASELTNARATISLAGLSEVFYLSLCLQITI